MCLINLFWFFISLGLYFAKLSATIWPWNRITPSIVSLSCVSHAPVRYNGVNIYDRCYFTGKVKLMKMINICIYDTFHYILNVSYLDYSPIKFVLYFKVYCSTLSTETSLFAKKQKNAEIHNFSSVALIIVHCYKIFRGWSWYWKRLVF